MKEQWQKLHVLAARDVVASLPVFLPSAVLSIEHPGAEDLESGRAPRLARVSQLIQCYWDTETPHPQGPTPETVAEGLAFLKERGAKGPVIIHCRQGKARSTAMALAFLAASDPSASADDCVARLKAIRPQAAPNILVVRHADTVLGLNGALERAVLADPVLDAARARANASRAHYLEKNPAPFNWTASPATP